MDYSSMLYTPGPDAARMAAPQPAAIPSPVPEPQMQGVPVEQPQVPASVPAPQSSGEPAVAAPPAAPGLWDKFRDNPNLMQAAMMTGLRLMHGQRNGQDSFGLVSDALMAGNLAYQYSNQSAADEGRRVAEDQRKEKDTASQIDWRGAQTEGKKQETAFKAQLQPHEMEKVQAEVERLRQEGKVREAEALIKTAEAAPEYLRKRLQAGLDLTAAQTGQYNAAAGNYTANTANTNLKTKAGEQLLDAKDARTVWGGGRGQESAVAQQVSAYMSDWKMANPQLPGESKESYAQRAATESTRFWNEKKRGASEEQFLNYLKATGQSPMNEKQWEKARAGFDVYLKVLESKKPQPVINQPAGAAPAAAPSGAPKIPEGATLLPGKMSVNGKPLYQMKDASGKLQTYEAN